jgi:hypothetical protein
MQTSLPGFIHPNGQPTMPVAPPSGFVPATLTRFLGRQDPARLARGTQWLRAALLVATLLVALTGSTALAQTTNTWTGNAGQDWNTTGNWSLTLVPTATHNVVIPPSLTNYPLLSSVASASTVEVQSGASFTITSAGSLSINGNKSVSGNTTGFDNGGTVVNGGQLVLGSSTTANVGSYGLFNKGSFSNVVGGTIQIDRSTGNGLYNAYGGSFVNSSSITIGATASVGSAGLYNYASFSNVEGGSILIDRSTGNGLYNSSGSFVNSSSITIGATASVGSYGLANYASFSNVVGGSIQIDRSTSRGLYNGSGTFVNSARITIGATASVGQGGLQNYASFSNVVGGTIQIDRSTETGLSNAGGGRFVNSARITIGASASVGQYGLENYASFSNVVGGSILIDRSTNTGLWNTGSSSFVNSSSIIIGASASVGSTGLYNGGSFSNVVGGTIQIDRSTSVGLYSSYRFVNSASITIGASASVGTTAVQNDYSAIFDNSGCSALLNVVANAVITNGSSATFTNTGTLIENASGTSNISFNGGVVQNLNGGSFTITTNSGLLTTSGGLIWTGCTSTDWNTATNWSGGFVPTATDNVVIPSGRPNWPVLSGTGVANSVEVQSGASFTITDAGSLSINGNKLVSSATTGFDNGGTVVNGGQLVLGSSTTANVGQYGLFNKGSFSNGVGGSIQIDRSTSNGLYNAYGGSFVNSSSITIGATASTSVQYGLYNGGRFSNMVGGSIQIDRSTSTGLVNAFSFVNSARIIIGATASVGFTGLNNEGGSFSNVVGGSIQIDRSANIGLENTGGEGESGSFVNSSSITIGASASVGATAVRNVSSAFFYNSGCSALLNVVADAVISNSASFTNTGTIIENANGNSTITFNGGVVQNLNGGTFTIGGGTGPLSVTVSNPTNCITPNGSLTIIGLRASTSYTLSYTVGSSTTVLTPTSTGSGEVLVSSLAAGVYSLLLSGSCLAQNAPLSATLNAPTALTAGLVASGTLTCASPTVSLTATGGTSYSLSDGQSNTGGVFSVSAGGTYSVVVSNAGGCTATASTTVVSNTAAPTGLSLTASNSGTLTCAVTTLTLTATPTGQTTYVFSSGATPIGATNLATVNASGTYSVTITNAGGCTATVSTQVQSSTAAPTGLGLTASNSGTLTCAVPSLTLTATPTGQTNYQFSSGASRLGTTNLATVNAPGTYSVTITNANGCTATASTTVFSNTAAPTSPMLTASPNTTLTCAQTSLTLTASATGGNSFTFSGPAGVLAGSGTTRVVSTSGLYSMTVTAANGCTNTASVSIESNTPSGNSNISPIANGSTVCEGSTVVVPATVISSGGGRQWYKDGTLVAGQTSATLTLGGVLPAQAGSYVLVVTGGCSATSNAFVLTVNPLPSVLLVFPLGVTIGSGNPPAITLPDPLPAGFDLSFGVQGGVSFERTMILDRVNGFEIRQIDSSGGRFPITRSGLFSITGTSAQGCRRTVQGMIANVPASPPR